MAIIKDALSSLPARPAVLIAPLIVVGVLFLYYQDLRGRCNEVRDYRAALQQHLLAVGRGASFRLADFTGFDWNKLRIVAQVKPGSIDDECLFDWNWESGERESLLADGNLSALIFGLDGRVIRYFELRRDEIAFPDTDEQLTPQTAVFGVKRDFAGGAAAVSLTLLEE
jgi:hypothetical protein